MAFCLFVSPIFNRLYAADFSGTWYGPYFYNEDAYGLQGSLTVSITQTGNAISGTYVSSSGDTGKLSGQATGDQLTVDMESPAGPFMARGTFAAKLHRDVLVWEGIGYLNDSTGTVSGALTRNWVKNVSHRLGVFKNNFPSGVMWGHVLASISEPTGQTIDSVVMVTPHLDEFPVNEWDADDNRYEGGYSFDVTNVEIAYPNGVYAFSILFKDGTRGACFSCLSGGFSDQIPEILTPLPDTEVDETQPLPVAWNLWLSPGVFSNVAIYFDIDHFQSLSKEATEYALPANTLPDNYLEIFKVGFSRESGYFGGKSVESFSYIRTTSHKLQGYRFAKVKIKLPSGEFAGGVVIGMDASGVTNATLIPPAGAAGASIALDHGEEQFENWEGWARYATISELETRYPDGSYILRINYADGARDDITLNMTGSYPSAVPDITQPVNMFHLDWWRGFSAQWTEWPLFNTAGNFIVSFLNTLDTATEAGYLLSEEVWSSTDGIRADGMDVPHGVLKSAQNYAYEVLFLQESTPGVMKGTGNVVLVNTSAMPAATLAVGLAGDGKGRVVSNDSLIDCSSTANDCQANYNQHQQIVLIAISETRSVFSGWSGDDDCSDGVVGMTENRNCTARFTFKNCPDCSGDVVTIQNEIFYSGADCRCTANTSITTGPGVIIESGATVTFTAPVIKMEAGIHINEGGVFTTNLE